MRISSVINVSISGDYWGQSSAKGFVLHRTANGQTKTVSSVGYTRYREKDPISAKDYLIFIVSGAIFLFYTYIWGLPLSALFSRSANPLAYVALLILAVVGVLFSVALSITLAIGILQTKTEREYHGCEHKTANLLMSGLEPNLKNLKKIPRLFLRCTTSITGAITTWPLIIGAYLRIAPLLKNTSLTIIIAEIVLVISVLIACPLLMQFFFTTAEPSEEKLREALDVIKEFRNEP